MSAPAPPTFDPLELYASGIDTSDYVARVAPLVREILPETGDLLDIGSGGGQLGSALRDPERRWTAVEPSPTMQRRLRRLSDPPSILPVGWEAAHPTHDGYDTVLAANIAAPLTSAPAFLDRCREWSRRSIVWVVPAQDGPRGLCLAGCLPRDWHGEDETPGVDIVLSQLLPANRPQAERRTSWSFRLTVPNVPAIASYLADRLGWPLEDARRPKLAQHLAAAADPVEGGFRLTVPRRSAILVWGKQ
jgi:hypothetical protein